MGLDFQLYKKNVLNKLDKSKKGSFDKRIIKLCELINSLPFFVTTSSCSGRIVLLRKNKKHLSEWVFVTHDLAKAEDVKLSKEVLWFVQESAILHVACETLEKAQELIDLVKSVGFSRSGIISVNNKFVVEMVHPLGVKVPVSSEFVSKPYLNLLVREANKKLELNWNAISALVKAITFKYCDV